ncbi:hypothetical protein DFS34DRAFT_237486 [Phlyctochytrium arcticum]|nr:hypothetical protein DFS34DRAFT_237486 [Phlyctochytrium arcticum]
MAVSYTSWNMSQDLPTCLADFQIELDHPEVVLRADEGVTDPGRARGDVPRLQGKVVLACLEEMTNVRAVTLRFVGGVVSKRVADSSDVQLRGPQKLFDRSIYLYEKANSEASPPTLTATTHTFHFALKLPTHMPPSMKYPRGQVQYMLVASLEWEPTCWGIAIPGFRGWRNIVVKREVIVRKVPGRMEDMVRRVQQEVTDDGEEKRVTVVESATSPSRSSFALPADEDEPDAFMDLLPAVLTWSPHSTLSLAYPARHPLTNPPTPLPVTLTSTSSLTNFDSMTWSLRQHEKLTFTHVAGFQRSNLDAPQNAIRAQEAEVEAVLRAESVLPEGEWQMGDSTDVDCTALWHANVPLLDEDIVFEDVRESLDTEVLKIHHYADIILTYTHPIESSSSPESVAREDESKSSSPTASDPPKTTTTTTHISLPIILYIPPQHPEFVPEEEEVDDRPPAYKAGEEGPPGYGDVEDAEDAPLVAGGPGLRRRKV